MIPWRRKDHDTDHVRAVCAVNLAVEQRQVATNQAASSSVCARVFAQWNASFKLLNGEVKTYYKCPANLHLLPTLCSCVEKQMVC